MQPSAWDAVRTLLQQEVAEGIYDTWLRPTRGLPTVGNCLRVGVPNEMFGEWLRSQYLALIRSALMRSGLGHMQVEFVAPAGEAAASATPGAKGPGAAAAAPSVASAAARPAAGDTPRLNPRYSFDGFVVSSCNQFAHAAALAVCDQPGRAYNPLFLYGGVGLGKTHLMQAIGNRLLTERPTAKLRYLTSEQFMNELIAAIRFEETARFRDRTRQLDILLVDDIQFLAGKESTQEEFFH
ncbi:MAG: DnaA/Hda family protein, partial [Acidobacteria bacterium]|nr:DnaA/Hda family protein [Acidobacteriota bacterium]